MNFPNEHPDPSVRRALIELIDSLCQWERSTGRGSTLILLENEFHIRAVDGKPNIPDYITDEELLALQRIRP